MRQSKSPQLKKRDAYDRDHRPLMENPHAFRKNWRKKKAREHRRDRAALRSALAAVDGAELTAVGAKRLRWHRHPTKSFVMTLRERIAFALRRRDCAGASRPAADRG
jgi:hypothetical protein